MRNGTPLASIPLPPVILAGTLLGLILVLGSALPAAGQTATPYRQLVSRIPSGANTVLIFNVEKILRSPMGVRLGWDKNLQKAFADGVSRVPPQAEGYILAAQVDFKLRKPIWEAAAAELRTPLSLKEIAKRRSGTADVLEGLDAVELPNDTYVVQLDDDTLAAMGPANRQLVMQWVRDIKRGARVSPYLEKAAGYSDDAGTEVIFAVDLEGAFAPKAIQAYLETKQSLLDPAKADPQEVARLLASLQGVRLGIRIGEKPFGKLVVDLDSDITIPKELGKAILLEILGDAGMLIADFNQWTPECQGREFSLAGDLSQSGLRRIFSLVETPLPTEPSEASAAAPSPEDAKKKMATNSQQQFDAIEKMLEDIKEDWRDLKQLSTASVFFDRYAKKMEKLPVLNVDADMLAYRDYVALQLRTAADAVRTKGIRSSLGSYGASAGGTDPGYYNGGYGYQGGWNGGYGYGYGYNPLAAADAMAASTNAFHAALREEGAQRRAVRVEAKTTMVNTLQDIRANVIEATTAIRRVMTQRYQIEF